MHEERFAERTAGHRSRERSQRGKRGGGQPQQRLGHSRSLDGVPPRRRKRRQRELDWREYGDRNNHLDLTTASVPPELLRRTAENGHADGTAHHSQTVGPGARRARRRGRQFRGVRKERAQSAKVPSHTPLRLPKRERRGSMPRIAASEGPDSAGYGVRQAWRTPTSTPGTKRGFRSPQPTPLPRGKRASAGSFSPSTVLFMPAGNQMGTPLRLPTISRPGTSMFLDTPSSVIAQGGFGAIDHSAQGGTVPSFAEPLTGSDAGRDAAVSPLVDVQHQPPGRQLAPSPSPRSASPHTSSPDGSATPGAEAGDSDGDSLRDSSTAPAASGVVAEGAPLDERVGRGTNGGKMPESAASGSPATPGMGETSSAHSGEEVKQGPAVEAAPDARRHDDITHHDGAVGSRTMPLGYRFGPREGGPPLDASIYEVLSSTRGKRVPGSKFRPPGGATRTKRRDRRRGPKPPPPTDPIPSYLRDLIAPARSPVYTPSATTPLDKGHDASAFSVSASLGVTIRVPRQPGVSDEAREALRLAAAQAAVASDGPVWNSVISNASSVSGVSRCLCSVTTRLAVADTYRVRIVL